MSDERIRGAPGPGGSEFVANELARALGPLLLRPARRSPSTSGRLLVISSFAKGRRPRGQGAATFRSRAARPRSSTGTLFKTAIAINGAYNRTLTPFGFQNEQRSFWDATELYARISPFFFAHRVVRPTLLIHGAVDENPGTLPMQSERYFQALSGNGAPVRYLSMPFEGHQFRGDSSVLHIAAEMRKWLDRHLGDPSPAATAPRPPAVAPPPSEPGPPPPSAFTPPPPSELAPVPPSDSR